MDGVQVIRQLLVADATLTGLVPSTRISAGIMPQGTPLPAVTIQSISSIDRNILSPGVRRHVVERVQVTVIAPDYPSQKDIMRAVKKACADQAPTVSGLSNIVVHTQAAGPDFLDEEASFFMGNHDFRVSYNEVR